MASGERDRYEGAGVEFMQYDYQMRGRTTSAHSTPVSLQALRSATSRVMPHKYQEVLKNPENSTPYFEHTLTNIAPVPLLQRKSVFPSPRQEEQQLRSRIQSSHNSGHALEEKVQQQLERGVGMDLSEVRVHTGAEADQLSRAVHADAFTTGSHIFFRSGRYQPQSTSGFHLLAHEVTHVMQQATGPVAGSPVGGGISISDPQDRFEQAAERSAGAMVQKRAASSEITEGNSAQLQGKRTSPYHREPPESVEMSIARKASLPHVQDRLTTGNMQVQRRVGFEFEAEQDTWEMKGWKRTDQLPTLNDAGIKITDTKKKLYNDTAARFGVGADNGHIEFITDPLASWTEVKQAFVAMYTLAANWVDKTHPWYTAGTGNWVNGPGYVAYRPSTKGKLPTVPQATVGTAIMNIPRLLQGLSQGLNTTFIHGTNRTEVQYKPEWYIQDKEVLKAIADALKKVEVVINRANEGIKEYGQTIISQAKDSEKGDASQNALKALSEARGFLTSIALLLSQASVKKGVQPKDDVKYRFGLMHRTDFHSAYMSLSAEAQNFVQILLWPEAEDAASSDSDDEETRSTVRGIYNREHVLAKQYIPPDVQPKQPAPGPTIEEWIDSIISAGSYRKIGALPAELPKDLMSPPPGHRAHTGTGNDEGLGAYGLDTSQGNSLFLYELRGLATPVYPDQWIDLAREICRLAAVTQNDRNLYPTD